MPVKLPYTFNPMWIQLAGAHFDDDVWDHLAQWVRTIAGSTVLAWCLACVFAEHLAAILGGGKAGGGGDVVEFALGGLQ